jgi:hypothetical protein
MSGTVIMCGTRIEDCSPRPSTWVEALSFSSSASVSLFGWNLSSGRWETELRLRLRHRNHGESRRHQRLPQPKATAPAADSTLFWRAPIFGAWKEEIVFGG